MARISREEPKWYQEELMPYAKLYSQHREKALPRIKDLLDGLSEGDIARLVKAAKACTPSNCWYATYEVAKFILERYV